MQPHHGGESEMGYYRLSMSVGCAAVLRSPPGGMLPVASSALSPSSGLLMLYTVCSSLKSFFEKMLHRTTLKLCLV